MTALHLAVTMGDVGMLRLLAAGGEGQDAERRPRGAEDGRRGELCKRNQLGWCALHTAAFRGQEVAARLLLDAGTPVDWPTADGSTALHLAAARNRWQNVDRSPSAPPHVCAIAIVHRGAGGGGGCWEELRYLDQVDLSLQSFDLSQP